MATPLTMPMVRTTAGVTRARRAVVTAARMNHQLAEPRPTPATTSAGFVHEPLSPAPSAAASAANEMTVAGLVMVRPRIEVYAQASPAPLTFVVRLRVSGVLTTARTPMTTSARPPASASQRAAGARAVVTTAATPKTATAA